MYSRTNATFVFMIAAIVFGTLFAVTTGQRVKRQSPGCGFTVVDNASFVEAVYPMFSDASDTRILEYYITFSGLSQDFDWTARSWPGAYQPHRWFRTQGVGSSRLLLVYHYYYGLMKPFMGLGIEVKDVQLEVTPSNCLRDLLHDQLYIELRDFLLQDFNINSRAVENPFTYSQDVEICSQHIQDVDGWGRLQYTCCGYNSEGLLVCSEIYEDGWVWALRAFLVGLTVLLFLYLPALLPHGYKILSYYYYPPDQLKFNFIITTRPDKFRHVKTAQVLSPNYWKSMSKFQSGVSGLQREVVHTAHVSRANLSVGLDRILSENQSPVSFMRSIFDGFVRCHIRHSDPLEACCKTSCCGVYCCGSCPPWLSWLRAIRTILVMALLSLPALPLFYALSADDLDFQQLQGAISDMGLERTFNFYAGPIFGKVIVAVIAAMYVVHTIILVADGATDGYIARLYTDVLGVVEKKASLHRKVEKTQNLVKKVFNPVRKCGVIILPIWILVLLLLPVILIILFIIHAPVFRILMQAFKKLLRRMDVLHRNPNDKEKFSNFCEMFWFLVTIVFVFVVLSIGANFLVHAVAMIVIKVVVDARLVYRVLPVILLLLFYIRDAFQRVSQQYQAFHTTVLSTIKAKEAEDLRRESLKSWHKQQNKIFKIIPQPAPVDSDDEEIVEKRETIGKGYASLNADLHRPEKTRKKNLFFVKNNRLRMHLQQLLLFLDKNDILYSSKKFIFYCSTMDCGGAPGILEENFIHAIMDFMKIAVFLLFVFLVVMAYGNAYYISPTNHLFVTLVSGVVPLVLRNVFLTRDPVEALNTSDYRFEAELRDKIETFSQSWDLDDLVLKNATPSATSGPVEKLVGEKGVYENLSPKALMTSTPRLNPSSVDLVIDVSQEDPGLNGDNPPVGLTDVWSSNSKVAPGVVNMKDNDNRVSNSVKLTNDWLSNNFMPDADGADKYNLQRHFGEVVPVDEYFLHAKKPGEQRGDHQVDRIDVEFSGHGQGDVGVGGGGSRGDGQNKLRQDGSGGAGGAGAVGSDGAGAGGSSGGGGGGTGGRGDVAPGNDTALVSHMTQPVLCVSDDTTGTTTGGEISSSHDSERRARRLRRKAKREAAASVQRELDKVASEDDGRG